MPTFYGSTNSYVGGCVLPGDSHAYNVAASYLHYCKPVYIFIIQNFRYFTFIPYSITNLLVFNIQLYSYEIFVLI